MDRGRDGERHRHRHRHSKRDRGRDKDRGRNRGRGRDSERGSERGRDGDRDSERNRIRGRGVGTGTGTGTVKGAGASHGSLNSLKQGATNPSANSPSKYCTTSSITLLLLPHELCIGCAWSHGRRSTPDSRTLKVVYANQHADGSGQCLSVRESATPAQRPVPAHGSDPYPVVLKKSDCVTGFQLGKNF